MLIVLPLVLAAGYFSAGPALLKYSPELCGVAISAYIVLQAARNGFARIRLIYWVLIILLALHVLFGILANGVHAGTVIVGGRMYLRTLPFFLLPLVAFPGHRSLKKQFLVISAAALAQLPVAVYQKIWHHQRALLEGYVTMTGDWVTGTIGGPGFLSLFLIMFSTVPVALYARKVISARLLIPILLIVLVPTMINETKATFFLAPLAIAIPLIAVANRGRLKKGMEALVLAVGFLAIFVPVYDYFMTPRWGYGLLDFLTMEGRVERYLSKDDADVGTTGPVGRLDTVTMAYDILQKDATSLAFGLGMGNVTESVFGPRFEGAYYSVYGRFTGTTYARLFWEIGIIGVTLVLLLLFQVFKDAWKLMRSPDLHGNVALAYTGIIPIVLLGMLYQNLLLAPGISICFWYYCGVIAAASQNCSAPPSCDIAASKAKGESGIRRSNELTT